MGFDNYVKRANSVKDIKLLANFHKKDKCNLDSL